MPLTSSRFSKNKRLQDAAENRPPLKRPESSDAVKLLQQALVDLGYKMPRSIGKAGPDGVYGNETYAIVRRFQIDQKFWTDEMDGIAGRDTLTRLDQLFLRSNTEEDQKALSRNLGFSMQAVNHVLRKIKLQAPNWDRYRGEPSWEDGTAPQDPLDVCLYEKDRPKAKELFLAKQKKSGASVLDYYRIVANLANKNGCGNCGENSILAFMFLYDLGVRPIDRMELDQKADHAFVVIGRAAGDANDWANWGPRAVVCDPWAVGFRKMDKAIGTYPGTQFGGKMTELVPSWKSVHSSYRES
jgi:peptidoglycan hydrolase-like protein with peptidoglycan-binding domain